MNREDLYNHLKDYSQVLQTESLDRAFKEIDRKDFVRPDYEVEAYEDYALPIGFDQTISQPTTVAFMLELLDIKEDQRVLDIGSGSGWTTALLASIVGEGGLVLGLELIPELVEFGRANLTKYNFPQAEIKEVADEEKELDIDFDNQYDRILVSASANELPEAVVNKLSLGGVMVIPVGNSIFKITKQEDGEIGEEEFPGFSFAPLV